mmetsp:Transcript_22005/g.50194  ORF Transcript_22005/g.50194 Transcript_22005/m.50194 type:complete len:285 (-) Transcript_22005:541-1395(-)
MEFMNVSSEPSKPDPSATIDASALMNMGALMSDTKVYNTAYINLDKGGKYYDLLTKNVVRGAREARGILLKAQTSGQVERLRVVQALQALSREFDRAMAEEEERRRKAMRKVPVMDGMALFDQEEEEGPCTTEGGFVLSEPEDMRENLGGEWRLQLVADKKGEGVKYFDEGTAWQTFDKQEESWRAFSPVAFLKVVEEGTYAFEDERRVVRKTRSSSDDGAGGFLTSLLSGSGGERISDQQVMSVDSEVCITRRWEQKVTSDNIKGYFAVWRRVDVGTYSKASQ